MFIVGDGSNGKFALMYILRKLLGNDYSTEFPIRALLTAYQARDSDAATPALTKLQNRRLAIVEEIPQGKTLDIALFKNLTGGDSVPIRRLHHEASEFESTHKFILSGQHYPELQAPSDLGLQRRLINVHFEQRFDGDPKFKYKLVTPYALSGFLTILVEQAKLYYQDGLIESSAMEKAKNDYLRGEDWLLDFIQVNRSFLVRIQTTAPCLSR